MREGLHQWQWNRGDRYVRGLPEHAQPVYESSRLQGSGQTPHRGVPSAPSRTRVDNPWEDWEPLPDGVDNPRATNNARVDNPWLDWEPVPLAAGKGWQPRNASNNSWQADFAPGY